MLYKGLAKRIEHLFLDYRLDKLKNNDRGRVGCCIVGNYEIKYTDVLSFYYEYQDIFKSKNYHFVADNDAPVIIDLGGCIGMATLYFKFVYPHADITVFEPDPKIFSVLRTNIDKNKLSNVTLINAGVGKCEENIIFYSDGSDGGSGFNMEEGAQKTSVKIVKLSDLITRPIDLLKMNIEGMEGDVFEEIELKLPLVKEIIFEYHVFHSLPQTLGKILTILDRNGFRYLVSDATSTKISVPFSLPQNYRYFNLVYAKRLR